MSSEEKVKLILSLLKSEIEYDKEIDSYLDDAFSYMKNNINSPLTLEFSDQYERIKNGLYNQIKELDDILKSNVIKNKEFKNAFIISHIPFKCDEQYFIYKLIRTLNNDYINDETFDAILPQLNKYLFDNAFDTNLLLSKVEDNYDYNVVKNKNFYEKNKEKNRLMKKYQEGNLIINNPRVLSKQELEAVGYRGELYFKKTHSLLDPDNLFIWCSQNVNGFSHIDFLEYNHKIDHLYPHEVKTTVTNYALNNATISEKEFEYMYDTLDSKNITYNLYRYAFSQDLIEYKDGIRFVIIDKNNVNAFDDKEKELSFAELFCKDCNEIFFYKLPDGTIYYEGFEETKKKLSLKKE